jgi:hypothetical protein
VKFALPEDAARAAGILHRSDFKGRALAVELAMKRGQKPANVPDAPAAKRAKAAAAAAAAAKAPAKEEGEGAAAETAAAEAAAEPALPSPQKKQQQQAPKPRQGQEQESSPGAAKKPKKAAPALVGQHPSNTLLVFNLAEQTTEKQLYKRVKKLQPPTSVKMRVRC